MANNYNNKKYYWIKLRDTFMTSDAVDFLMGQKDGANYVVLYQMLCLKTINTDGELSRTIGEMIIPYDIDKIVRDTKYFTKDTVLVALELYKKLALIYQNDNGNLAISNFEQMVGSETQSAVYKQQKRLENFQQDSNRDKEIKRIDIRDKDIIDKYCSNIHAITPIEIQKIEKWEETFADDVIAKAIEIAVSNNVRTINYIEGILNSWKDKGYKTLSDIESETKKDNKPTWFKQDIKKEEATKEEQEELKELMKKYN